MPSDATILTGTYSVGVTLTTPDTTIAYLGLVRNPSGSAVTGPRGSVWTLTNYGTVAAPAGVGVYLYSGSLINAASGTITGYSGGFASDPGTLVNAGSIGATGTHSYGVSFAADGSVTNTASGTIASACNGVLIGGAGTVVNDGTIIAAGSSGYGVSIGGVGSVVNAGHITGSAAGIAIIDGGTVINQGGGTISGHDAVTFAAGYVNRLVVDPHAVFVGTADGGNAPGGQHVSTLELASGTSIGTLSGLGSQYINFGHVTVDAGARWTFQASDTVEAGVTLTNAGTIGGGVILAEYATLLNQASGTITGGTAVYGQPGGAQTLVNAGKISGSSYGVLLQSGGSVTNAGGGTILGKYAVQVSGAYGTVDNAGTIKGGAGGGAYMTGNGAYVINRVSGTISGTAYGIMLRAAGTVINDGSIASPGNGALAYTGAIALNEGGTVINNGLITGAGRGILVDLYSATITNAASGTIITHTGIYIHDVGSTVVNAGAITATNGNGVYFNGGMLVNDASGRIIATRKSADMYQAAVGGYGVTGGYVNYAATVLNLGTIIGTKIDGVYLRGGGTLINAGTISGGSGHAVLLGGNGNNKLVIDPGAVFNGNIIAYETGNTLELASGASTGVVHGLGNTYQDFQQIIIDAGASWSLTGTNTIAAGVTLSDFGTLTGSGQLDNEGIIVTDPSDIVYSGAITGAGTIDIGTGSDVTFNGSVAQQQTIAFADNTGTLTLGDTPGFVAAINGFVLGDTIALTGVTDATTAQIVNGSTLEITRTPDAPIDLTLDPAQDYTGTAFNVVEQGGNAIVTLACFAEGTRIATPDGHAAVETLRPGDLILTAGAAARPVRWIGFRRIDLSRHPAPDRAQPIVIAANAFAEGQPSRDLRLSPDHAVALDGMLIPVRLLLNHASIHRPACRAVTYFHVELDTHDILLAEGLPVESYLDTGNRGMFENAGILLLLHPTFRNGQARRQANSCMPFVADADQVEPLWHRLAERAARLGFALPDAIETTDEPDLLITTDSRIIQPTARTARHYTFLLPAGSQNVRLLSRAAAPCDQHPWIEDHRQLGVMVRRITQRHDGTHQPIPLDHPQLTQGWWDVEHDTRCMWRWTNGGAVLPNCGEQLTILDIELAGTARYPVQNASAANGHRQRAPRHARPRT